MNDPRSRTAAAHPRFQFNLKFVLAVMAACAVSLAVVPFDARPVCPLAMLVLVVSSIFINLTFWGWPPSSRAAHALAAVCVGLAAGASSMLVCVPLSFTLFEGRATTRMHDYFVIASWWLGGFVGGTVANQVVNRHRRRARAETHWSERPVDGPE